MQAAWIISAHLAEAWLFETSSVLGLQEAGRSKNTISQVVSHELKIAEHGFPVRLLRCPPNLPATISPFPQPTQHSTHTVSWQKAAFPPTWWRNLPEWKTKGDRKKKYANWSGHRYMTYIPPLSPHPSPAMVRLSSKDVFTMFYHPFFFKCTSGTCELDGKRGENVAETPQWSWVSELSQSLRWRPYPLLPERLHKRLN